MNYHEAPLLIDCLGNRMLSILSIPEQANSIGVLIIVGGPQYRAGSHRQFTLLARHLASNGFPAMRFDYRGMGDSEGDARNFESIGEDIRAALDAFFTSNPDMTHAVLWGLCDAASAAICYAPDDRRVAGLVLLNPWVHTEEGAARVLLRHYYLRRLVTREFWLKVLHGRLNLGRSLASMKGIVTSALCRRSRHGTEANQSRFTGTETTISAPPLRSHMRECLENFGGRVLLFLSGKDFTAREFRDLVKGEPKWQSALERRDARIIKIEEADHVFSSRIWSELVNHETLVWIRIIGMGAANALHW